MRNTSSYDGGSVSIIKVQIYVVGEINEKHKKNYFLLGKKLSGC